MKHIQNILDFNGKRGSENKVFLGGTCNKSTWRNRLIPMLKCKYFNPVVDDWTPECQEIEEREKKTATYQLYVITPLMTGVFSIAEVVQASNKDPKHTVFCVLMNDDGKAFDEFSAKSMNATMKLVRENGAFVFDNLEDVANFLNNQFRKN